MEVCGTELRRDSSAQGKRWHSSTTLCKGSYLPPMPLDANSLPPHLRGMPCTCRLLTPPQAELQHGAAEREQHATPRHRLQGERWPRAATAHSGQGAGSHTSSSEQREKLPTVQKTPFERYTWSYSMLYGEGNSSISYCRCLWRMGFVVVFLEFLHKQFNLPWDLGQYHGGLRAFIPLPASFCWRKAL